MLLSIDIGKTTVKVRPVTADGCCGPEISTSTPISKDGPYPHIDVDLIWAWLLDAISKATRFCPVSKICVAAHGAGAACTDSSPEAENGGLALPILDYEWEGVREFDAEYDSLRPAFSESFSPSLPAGLNLGRQLYWQSKRYFTEFESARWILPYPQYWSWRLAGVAASEISSLGCHTDLWAPKEGAWSSLAKLHGWQHRFAPMRSAWETLGVIKPEVAAATGLSKDCAVLTGVHDSNASYARFLNRTDAEPFAAIVSTGTWAISMNPKGDLERLYESRDMLANVDVEGGLVSCARFMGGREYSEICKLTGCGEFDVCSFSDIANILEDGVFALPDFGGGSGPFGGRAPQIRGRPKSGAALAAVYLALMIDYELELLGVDGPVVIEGRFSENRALCAVLGALRERHPILRLPESSGIALGCLTLARRDEENLPALSMTHCETQAFHTLCRYKHEWRRLCERSEPVHA